MEYYLYLNDEQKGPYTLSQLQSMWRSGNITGNTLYWQEGFSDWASLSSILHVIEPPTIAPPPSLPSATIKQAPVAPSATGPTSPNYLTRNIIACIILLLFLGSFGFMHIVRTGSG